MDEGKKLTELTPAQKAMKDRAQGTDRKRGEFHR